MRQINSKVFICTPLRYTVKYCPRCGAPNDDDANFCIKCGYRFPAVVGSEQRESSTPATGVSPSATPSTEVRTASESKNEASAQPAPAAPKGRSACRGWKASAIAFLVLLILVSGVMAYYVSSLESSNKSQLSQISSLQSQLNSDNSTISSLQSQVNSDNSRISSLQSQLNNENSQISSLESELSNAGASSSALQSELSSYQAIVNLQDSETLVSSQTVSQPAGYYTYWHESLNYPGYIEIIVSSSTTTKTYAEVSWTADGVNYSNSVTVGTSGTAYFPVLPSSDVVFGVGNNNVFNGATETVTIVYYY